MKKISLIFLIMWCACTKTEQTLPSASNAVNTAKAVKYQRIPLTPNSDGGLYIDGSTFSYHPGDTLVMKGSWTYCTLEGFHGNSSVSVVIINDGSQVQLSSGFSLTDCQYVKILGTGTKDKYGFRISTIINDGVGITVTGRSSDIEISNVDVYNKTYGYWIKQEADCADSLQFPNWVLNNISVHDGRIRVTNQEGMYMGSTDPNGLRAISCNGATIYPKPLRLGNIKVYNMVIDSCYRSGIQLSCASQGVNRIFNNNITNCGYEYNSNGQGSGISLGGYTQAYLYNNYISNTYTMGISSLGAGPVVIKNNTVKNSGNLSGHTVPGMANIMIDTRNTDPVDSTRFLVKDNILSGTTDFNVRVYKTYPTYAAGNIICNNGNNTTLSVDAGIQWSSCH